MMRAVWPRCALALGFSDGCALAMRGRTLPMRRWLCAVRWRVRERAEGKGRAKGKAQGGRDNAHVDVRQTSVPC